MTDFESFRDEFEEALVSLDQLTAKQVLAKCAMSCSTIQVVDELVVPVMQRIGSKWERGEIALAQVYMSARICEALANNLRPSTDPARKYFPQMGIAVLEDHHSLGKRIVYSTLRAGGFEPLDYGHGVKVDDLIVRVKNDGIRLLLVSTLMLPAALKVKDLREKLNVAGVDVRIIVGGAPFLFDDQLWREVGADAMGRSASDAVELVSRISEGLS